MVTLRDPGALARCVEHVITIPEHYEQRLFAAVSSRVQQSLLEVQRQYSPGERPRTLADQLQRAGERLSAGARTLAWVEHGGWDTHVAQSMRIDPLLSELSTQLAGFYEHWSERIEQLTIIAVSVTAWALSPSTSSVISRELVGSSPAVGSS